MTSAFRSKISDFLAGGLLFFAVLLPAHQVDQVYAELNHDEANWELISFVDVQLLDPDRGKDPFAEERTRDWLRKRSPSEFKELREQTSLALEKWIRLQGDELASEPTFPDFQETPPTFPENRLGAGIIRLRWAGPIPESGKLKLTISEDCPVRFVIRKADGEYLELGPESETQLVDWGSPSSKETNSRWTFFQLGFRHVLPEGIDHLLFLAGLLLGTRKFRSLLWISAAFTISHGIALGAVAGGLVRPPTALVEILIAGTIVLVALDNLRRMKRGTDSGGRLWMALLFGLIHGAGFASALASSMVGAGWLDFVWASLGIEVAQVLILLLGGALLLSWHNRKSFPVVRGFGSTIIAVAGVIWMLRLIFGW